MKEKPRDWEVSIREDKEVVFAQEVRCHRSTEVLIQDGLTKKEALAMLATMGEVKRTIGEGYFFVWVKK